MESKIKSNDRMGNGTNKWAITLDRFHNSDSKIVLKIGAQSYPILDFSYFSVAILGPKDFSFENIQSGILEIENLISQMFELKYIRRELSGEQSKIVFEVANQEIPVEQICLIPELQNYRNEVECKSKKRDFIPKEFRLIVYSLADFLRDCEKTINNLEAKQNFQTNEQEGVFYNTSVEIFSPYINAEIVKANTELFKIAATCKDEEELKECFNFFRNVLGHFIYQSPFAFRSYTKPLGYAGDYEMMNQIYRDSNHTKTLFAKCIEKAMQLHAEPQAVRNRTEYMVGQIRNAIALRSGPVHILSVASGPASEIQSIVSELGEADLARTTFHLLDQDAGALKFAQRSILKQAKPAKKTVNINLIHKPIKQIIVDGMPENTYDFVYSAGLFDYLSDVVAERAAKVIYSSLKNKGRMIVGNFDVQTPNKFGMLTLFDWHLILRSKEDLIRLIRQPNTNVTVESEKNGINLFCVVDKQ